MCFPNLPVNRAVSAFDLTAPQSRHRTILELQKGEIDMPAKAGYDLAWIWVA
jgi:hypothetical protein